MNHLGTVVLRCWGRDAFCRSVIRAQASGEPVPLDSDLHERFSVFSSSIPLKWERTARVGWCWFFPFPRSGRLWFYLPSPRAGPGGRTEHLAVSPSGAFPRACSGGLRGLLEVRVTLSWRPP